ncbi:Response regulator rcp1 [Syntrophobacter sp. SbD1]|nr:Response regulator rcp1 [Syntrophobacter sp. SbD1]
MNPQKIILSADDDEDDQLFIKDAFESSAMPSRLYFTEDGQDLLNYLRHQGKYLDGRIPSPRPDLILLDLNMPRKNGYEALQEIKSDPKLSTIPITVLTTSNNRDEITRCYRMGANSFVTKPASYDGFVGIANSFCSNSEKHNSI